MVKTTEKAFKEWQKGKGKMKDIIDSIVSDISNCKDEPGSPYHGIHGIRDDG